MTVQAVTAEQRSDPTVLALNPAVDIGARSGISPELPTPDQGLSDTGLRQGIVSGAPSPAVWPDLQ